jgi:hypothetical protein
MTEALRPGRDVIFLDKKKKTETDVSKDHSTSILKVCIQEIGGLLWTGDQSDAETSTWQHTKLKTGRHQCPQRDSNPQSQQAGNRRPTP